VQDQMSLDIAYQFKLDAILAGDTRLDNVIARAANSKPIDFIERRINKNKPIIIYGSIYKDDLDKISSFINTNEEYTHIVVPHDVSVENISQIEKYINLPYTITSKIENENQAKVILVDSIGLLFDLYQYADIAYIGGGFKKGIHNILEPLAYNIPVIFGSKYSKFNEANQAVNQNFAFSINSIEDFEEKINYIRTEKAEIKERIIEWKNSNKGATDRILACL
jgi:3-deoxy-D-manno-octulosonic-acid transferase